MDRVDPETAGVIKSCLVAAMDDQICPDWEFSILIGVEREYIGTALEAWPQPPDGAPSDRLSPTETWHMAVNNALNNLLGYPHGYRDAAFVAKIGVSESKVAEAIRLWRREDSFNTDPSGYADRIG